MSDQQSTTTQTGDRQPQTDAEKRYTQAEFDARLEAAAKDKLDRQRRTFEAQQREKEEALEVKRLEDTQEFEKLAQQRAKEIENLKPRAGLAESYEKGVNRLMMKATESLPSNIQTILNKLSLPDQLDWLAENLDSVKAPMVATGSADINAWSRGASGAPQPITDEEYRAKKRREMNW